MDKKFLNKVVDQIVYETEIDYDEKKVYLPFFISHFPSHLFPYLLLEQLPQFYTHCESVYGLNDLEIKYVWKKYKKIILDKIDSLH